MNRVFFLTGSVPPNTGGELYNYKLYEYLDKSGLAPEYIDLHKIRGIFKLSLIPIFGDLFVNIILAVIVSIRCQGILVEDHYFSYYLTLANAIQHFIKRSKIIIIVHHFDHYDSNDSFYIRKFFRSLKEKVSLYFADKIVTNSEYTKQEIVSLGLDNQAIFVCAPGLNKDKLEVVFNLVKEAEKPKIISVGHCIPRKGLIYLIEAFAKIEKRGFTLHIIGKTDKDKTYYQMVKNRIEELGLSQSVFLHHRLDQEELNHLYSSAELFVLPSLKEGFGIVLLEAMYYGLPIITTNICAMPELVKDGENGLLVPAADSQALAEAMSKLIENSDLRKQMGERGRIQVTNSYQWEKTGAKVLSIVQSMSS
jgi:glycosyltransferase involved in cell wall biosynthesis